MEYVGGIATGLLCVAVTWLSVSFLSKRKAEELLIRRKREDLLYEFAFGTTDISKEYSRWILILNRAKESDEEMHKAFPNQNVQEIAPLVQQWMFAKGI